ncbi:unnamed protein product [Fusarium graminearum]|nr:unnamed protein product [Fusarium graminearum]VTO89716.1 unnamed protein product [Fusarium graminearum]
MVFNFEPLGLDLISHLQGVPPPKWLRLDQARVMFPHVFGQCHQMATLQAPHRKVSAVHSEDALESRSQRLAHRHFPLKQGRLLARVR